MNELQFEKMFKDLPVILEKGRDLKKSEIKLLLDDNIPSKYIAAALDMTEAEFLMLRENWGLSAYPITLNEYIRVFNNFSSDVKVADQYGMSFNELTWLKKIWRKNGLEIPERRTNASQLTLEVYKELKEVGLLDKEIAEKFKINPRTVAKRKRSWGMIG